MSKFKIYLLFPDCFCLTEVSAGKFFLLPEIDIFISICTYVCILIQPSCHFGIAPSTQSLESFLLRGLDVMTTLGVEPIHHRAHISISSVQCLGIFQLAFSAQEELIRGVHLSNDRPEDNRYFITFLPGWLWIESLRFLDFRRPGPSCFFIYISMTMYVLDLYLCTQYIVYVLQPLLCFSPILFSVCNG